jgi:Pyruvate/2-oxoacid:ferredoxin oxidoreductase gamma subunit
MEREIVLTGVGGQSVQLAALVLGRAAALEDRHVMTLGTYGGTMRGGHTDSTLVVADAPIVSPPIVSRYWAALPMHHAFWEPVRAKLRPDAIIVCNASLFEGEVDRTAHRVFEVAATERATELGSALAGSLVLAGAFAALTGLVGVDSLVSAMHDSVPAYRRQHVETNDRALRDGFASVMPNAAPAWIPETSA